MQLFGQEMDVWTIVLIVIFVIVLGLLFKEISKKKGAYVGGFLGSIAGGARKKKENAEEGAEQTEEERAERRFFRLNMKEPYLSQVQDGKKKMEVRITGNTDFFKGLEGKKLKFISSERVIPVEVKEVVCYDNLGDFLSKKGSDVSKVFPDVKNADEFKEKLKSFNPEGTLEEDKPVCTFTWKLLLSDL